MLTKKDFKEIAAMIYRSRCTIDGGDDPLEEMNDLSKDFADFLALQNPRFSRVRFLAACRGKENTVKKCKECKTEFIAGEGFQNDSIFCCGECSYQHNTKHKNGIN